jgi:hypothetical protein
LNVYIGLDKSPDINSSGSSSANSTPSGSPFDSRKDNTTTDPIRRKEELKDRKETINVQLKVSM